MLQIPYSGHFDIRNPGFDRAVAAYVHDKYPAVGGNIGVLFADGFFEPVDFNIAGQFS